MAPYGERVRAELNLEKWPIWQPANSRKESRMRLLSRSRTLPDGSRLTAQVRISPNLEAGALTTEDQKTYYALVWLWEQRGFSEALTPFSLQELARLLKKDWGRNVRLSLVQSLMRLRATLFVWQNSYFSRATQETLELLETFNILSELKLSRRDRRGKAPRERGCFRFNDLILKNLLARHTKPVLLDTVLSFRSGIVQLLYSHLDLILSDKLSYERTTQGVFEDLALESETYARSFERRRKLEPALRELLGKPLSTGVITVARLERTRDGSEDKVVFRKASGRRSAAPQYLTAASPAGSISRWSELPLPHPRSDRRDPVSDQGDQEERDQEERDQEVQAPFVPDPARDLVFYFHQVFFGTRQKVSIPSRALDQARHLIARRGVDGARHLVEVAYRMARETGFRVQTFGGVLQYEAQAAAEYQRRRERPAPPERIGEALQRREAVRRRVIALRAMVTYRQTARTPPAVFKEFLDTLEKEREERRRKFPHPGPARDAMLGEVDQEEWRLCQWLDFCKARPDCGAYLTKLLAGLELRELKLAVREHLGLDAPRRT